MSVSEPRASHVAPLEALAVVAICFGWFIFDSLMAVVAGFPPGAAAFSDDAFLEIIVIELVFGAIALGMLRARGHSLAALLPAPSLRGCVEGVVLLVVALLAWSLVGSLFSGSEFARQPIAQMAARNSVSAPFVIALGMVNGLFEETFLVGYLLRGFRTLGPSFAIGVSVLVRLLYHLYQGPIGALSVLVFGVVVSLFYWRTGRLWPVVFAHALADALAFS